MLKLVNFMAKHNLPGHKTLRGLEFLRVFWKLVTEPSNTNNVFKLADVLKSEYKNVPKNQLRDYLNSREYYRQMLHDRYLAPQYKIEDLKECAPGTLGQVYYRHMTDNGFSKEFYPPVQVIDDLSYIEQRSNETHDIWHVVTGYGVDVYGEIALQAFYFGQTDDDGFAMLLVAAGLINTVLYQPSGMSKMLRGIIEGYQRGRAAKNFYPVQWEKMWNRSLEEIRAELNVDASPSVLVQNAVLPQKELAYAASS